MPSWRKERPETTDTKKEGTLVLNDRQKRGFRKNSVSKELLPNVNTISLYISIKIFANPQKKKKAGLIDHFGSIFVRAV